MASILKKLLKRTKKILIVDFGASIIDVAYVRTGPWGNKLLKHGCKRLSEPDKGKDEVLVAFINEFLRSNSVRVQDVVINIFDTESVFIKCLELPEMPEKEIFSAIKWQIKDEVPFELEGATYDWKLFRKITNEEGTKCNELVCGVVDQKAVKRYLAISKSCGLKPIRLTTNAFNYMPVLSHLSHNPKTIAVLNISCSDSTINIYENNKLNFVRRVPVSWEKLNSSLMGIFGTDQGKINLSPEQAEKIQIEVGIPQNDDEVIEGDIPATHLLPLMRPLLEALVREMRISFKYFNYNQDKEMPSVLYITGCGANLKNLDLYLKEALGLDVSVLPLPEKKMNVHVVNDEKIRKRLANVCGVALDGPSAINLLPWDIKIKKEEFVQKATVRVTATAICVVLMFFLFLLQYRISDHQRRLEAGQEHLRNLSKISELIHQYNEKNHLAREIQANKIPVDGLLKVVSEIIPSKLALNRFHFDQGQHRLTLRGTVSATEEVAEAALTEFMENIETSSFFYEARLVSSQKMGIVQEFEIICDVVGSNE